jgi:hypothetical protein
MTKNNARKGVSLLLIILLIAVSPTIMLSYDNNVGLAHAQDANQTSSSAATPSSPPSTQSPQTMQNTFRAEGVIGTLILDPNAISDAPPPSKFFGTIVGGNWSLAVVDRNIQNLTVNLLSIRPNGTIAEAAVISTITNDTGATSAASLSKNATITSAASSNTENNNDTTPTNNITVLQGVANVSINGTERWRDVPFALTMTGSTLINISIDSTRTENQFGGLPIHGIIMSMTDENGRNLLPGLPYFVSGTAMNTGNFGPPPLPGGGGGGPGGPGFGPPQFSDESIGTVATNQTCNVTPSIIEEEEEEEDEEVATTPQATEGPYFVDEMLNRSDIRADPSDGSTRKAYL